MRQYLPDTLYLGRVVIPLQLCYAATLLLTSGKFPTQSLITYYNKVTDRQVLHKSKEVVVYILRNCLLQFIILIEIGMTLYLSGTGDFLGMRAR